MQNEGGHGLALITATTLYVLLAAIGLSVGTLLARRRGQSGNHAPAVGADTAG